MVRRSSSYPSGRGEDPGTRGRKRENTIRQGARCISDMHAPDPNAAHAIVTQVAFSGCVAECPVVVNMQSGRIACLPDPNRNRFRASMS